MAIRHLDSFPKPLLDDLVRARWLPVVGAGLSHNAVAPDGLRPPLWKELGQAIAGEVREYEYVSAIDALSAFEDQYGRPRLVERISELLLVNAATPAPVHRAFCEIPFDLVCTTNLDFLLERQYQALSKYCIPLIEEEQLSLNSSRPGVSLLKIHGDLHHPGRMVLTEADYDCFLQRFPLLATYLGNLLITRTAVFIGYSLDDPDFRQIWQIVGERLGRSKRTAYAITVGAKPHEIARFGRRGVKVINLSGGAKRYGDVLAEALSELASYWTGNIVPASEVREEEPLQQLSLPRDAQTLICFFAIPLSLQAFYRDRIFPLVKEAGFVPMTADDLVTPGDNIQAKLDVILERARLAVADISSEWTRAELAFLLKKVEADRVLIITEKRGILPIEIQGATALIRPSGMTLDLSSFLSDLRGWLASAASRYFPAIEREASRLVEKGEYRAAVISAVTLFEGELRRQLTMRERTYDRAPSLRSLVQEAVAIQIISPDSSEAVSGWLRIRNDAVHLQAQIDRKTAQEVVNGVLRLIEEIRRSGRSK